jgi:hypothetical protein
LSSLWEGPIPTPPSTCKEVFPRWRSDGQGLGALGHRDRLLDLYGGGVVDVARLIGVDEAGAHQR